MEIQNNCVRGIDNNWYPLNQFCVLMVKESKEDKDKFVIACGHGSDPFLLQVSEEFDTREKAQNMLDEVMRL